MERHPPWRFWVEAPLAFLAFAFGILSLFWPNWIEGILHFDPDGRDGRTEWWIAASLLAATAIMAVTLGIERARRRAAPGPAAVAGAGP